MTHFVAFLALSLACVPLARAERLRVMLLDSVVDLDDPVLKPYLGWDTLHDPTVTIDRAIKPIEDVHRAGLPLALKALPRERRNEYFDPDTRTPGTNVARAIIKGIPADAVEMIPVPDDDPRPLSTVRCTLSSACGLFKSAERLRRDEADYFVPRLHYLSKLLRDRDVRLVNVSLSAPSMVVRRTLKMFASIDLHLSMRARFFRDLAAMNPDVLFVFAAGDESESLDQSEQEPFFNAGLPNVLVAAGLTEVRNDLIPESNVSSKQIDVAAGGIDLSISRQVMGSAMAAPVVSNQLVVQMLSHPRMSAAEFKALFLSDSTLPSVYLQGRVRDGRVLPGLSDWRAPGVETVRFQVENGIRFVNLERYVPVLRRALKTDRQRRRALLDTVRRGHLAVLVQLDGGPDNETRGVLYKNGHVTALDYRAIALKQVVDELLCESRLTASR